MPGTATLEVGQIAPDFKLKGPGGQFVTLSEFRGSKNVVLAFFPLAFSPVCSHQLPSIQKDLERFRDLDAEVMGISVDSHWANEAFARHLGLTFPLLADFRREVGAAYGVLLPEAGHSGRAIFIVDKEGKIAYVDVTSTPNQIPSNESALRALEALRPAG